MVREINGLDGFQPSTKSVGQNTKKSSQEPASTASEASQSGSDDVQLSSEARTLQSLTDRVNELPDVNVERAEQIKAALESGEYKVDDLVIADKLLSSEALFGK